MVPVKQTVSAPGSTSRFRERISASLLADARAGGPFTMMVAGRAGAGKSSTVNSLLGQASAKVSEHERGTAGVTSYSREIAGIAFNIIDTPGLGDIDHDPHTCDDLKKRREHINCMLCVTALDQPRQDTVDGHTLKKLYEIFPDALQNRSVVVLTKADLVLTADYGAKLYMWKCALREVLARTMGCSIWSVMDVPIVPVANGMRLNPDGEEWRDELLQAVTARSDRKIDLRLLTMARKDGHAREQR